MITVLLVVGSVWAVLFFAAAREEIADAWRSHHARVARRAVLKSLRAHR